LRFIHTLSYICANYLMMQLKESHEKRRVYYYGFQVIIGALVKGALLLTLALVLRIFVPTIVVVLVFASIRTIAGGYHMDTYGKCIAVSLGMFLVAGLIVQYTWTMWSSTCLVFLYIITFIIGFYTIYKYAPRDTPNKPITKPEEIRKFRLLSFIYIFVWLAGVGVLLYTGQNKFVIAAGFGLLLEAFAISPAGHKFFDSIKGGLNTFQIKRNKSRV